MTDNPAAVDGLANARPLRLHLSGKLFVVATLFVITADLLIYVPSIANFQQRWLQDRLAAARTAALAIASAPYGVVPDEFTLQILGNIDSKAVAIKTSQTRRLLAISHHLPAVTRNLDLRDVSVVRAVIDSFETLLFGENDLLRVVGAAPMGGDFIESVIEAELLRKAMWRRSTNLLSLLLVIPAIALIYLALHYLFIRPMRQFYMPRLTPFARTRT